MRARLAASVAVALAAIATSEPARATGLTDHGEDLEAAPEDLVDLSGYFRVRGSLLNNLDLDRGPTPSGQLLYPVDPTDSTTQLLGSADMRWRADLGLYAPWGGMALKARIDGLDNVQLGSLPDGIPAGSATQRDNQPAIKIRRVYAEIATPLGFLAFGRMGNGWGLGMLANGGDCTDCDGGDSADRVAWVLPLVGHLWAVAYDLTGTGPFADNRSTNQVVDVVPSAIVHTVTFAVSKWAGPDARARRSNAGKVTAEWGTFLSYRTQSGDVPATYLPTAQPIPITPGQYMARGYSALASDLWLRFQGKNFRVEAEAAYLHAGVDQGSLIPGVSYRVPIISNQFGAALETEVGDDENRFRAGLDAGFASGDEAPGFGAFVPAGSTAPQPGDIDGPQANPPFDAEVNNFRFHPDYRVDRILFREIIGTITDAVYVRPRVRYDLVTGIRGTLTVALAGVVSFAAVPSSTPSGAAPLGVELDPTLSYQSDFGFEAALEQGTLLPLAGLDNTTLNLPARPAQLWRLRLTYAY